MPRQGHALGQRVELSCTWGGATIHVLGYDFPLDAPPLLAAIEALHRGRWLRAEEIDKRLAAKGMPGTSTALAPCSTNWAIAATPRRARILPSTWCVPGTSRIAARRFANGWAPASWGRQAALADP